MFEQHPVPQNISTYQFKLVGNMNIKQFFQIAAGAIIALIIYGMPLPGFVKWPLIFVAAVSGAGFAFVPIQDRPMEKWLAAFFRSIYSPTIYTWQKQDPPPMYFAAEDVATAVGAVPGAAPVPASNQTFHQEATAAVQENKINEDVVPAFIIQDAEINQQDPGPRPGMTPLRQGRQSDSVVEGQATNSRPENVVPQSENISLEKKGYTENTASQPTQNADPGSGSGMTGVSEVLQTDNTDNSNAHAAQFSPDAAPPIPPDKPNIIKGQVMDSAGYIIEGAILEVKDKDGRPTRALKTNKAGHFQSVTPIANGEYNLLTEKPDYNFDPLIIKAVGEIIAPIAVRANNVLTT